MQEQRSKDLDEMSLLVTQWSKAPIQQSSELVSYLQSVKHSAATESLTAATQVNLLGQELALALLSLMLSPPQQ